MPVITVMYPGADGATFDHEYYMRTHIPLVRSRWEGMGLRDVRVMRGMAGPDGAAPTYSAMALLDFASMDAFKDAAAKHGAEIFADIPNFTNVKPVVQINETLSRT